MIHTKHTYLILFFNNSVYQNLSFEIFQYTLRRYFQIIKIIPCTTK